MTTGVKNSDAKLDALLGAAVDAIITINSAGLIGSFNRAAETMFGYSEAEVFGKNIKMLMPEPWASEHDGYMARYKETGEKLIIGLGRDVDALTKDGAVVPVHLSVGEYEDEGETYFVGILHDLSIRKRTEQALFRSQKMEAIGQLTGGIAHDFNNLLTIITGNLELLETRLEENQQLELLKEAEAAAEMGADLTARLLAIAKRSMLEPSELDLDQLIGNISQLLKRTLGPGIELETRQSEELWVAVADKGQLESAILNLAVNARDAMPDGGKLVLETCNQAIDDSYALQEIGLEAGEYVRISVSDNGSGIPNASLSNVFDPFFTTKPLGKGTGLGLSMVYGFAKQSGGHITIYSEEGVGTTVNLYLPRKTGPGTVGNISKTEPAGSELVGGDETILVVEDEKRVRDLIVKRLQMLGYNVMAAEDGKQAMAVLEEFNDIQIVITDLVMPGGMSGYDLAKFVVDTYKSVKVLLTSGYAEDLVNGGKLASRELPLLRKPYSQAGLATAVRNCLDAQAG